MRAPFRLVLAGQSLLGRPLHQPEPAWSRPVQDLVRSADVAFTNLETAIATPEGWPTRDHTCHVAPESVLDTVTWFGFRAVALASNHAFDYGPPGVIAALDATRRRGLLTAGTGVDATSAATPGIHAFGDVRVSLVAAVAAANPPGSHALDAHAGLAARPGVNRLRIAEGNAPGTDPVPDEADVRAFLRSIRIAARSADVVIVYLHNHYWADPPETAPGWVRSLAKRCVDDGADVVVGHGTPVLQGFEFYRGHLLAYGLGSFVFHTERPERYRRAAAWESVLVTADIAADGVARDVRLQPLVHGHHPQLDEVVAAHGAPALATGKAARDILARLSRLSEPLGATVVVGADGNGGATLEGVASGQRSRATTRSAPRRASAPASN